MLLDKRLVIGEAPAARLGGSSRAMKSSMEFFRSDFPFAERV